MNHSLRSHHSYMGQSVSDLPTPALVISDQILRRNIDRLHKDVETLGIDFRPHTKTLKCLEVTRLMLGNGKYRKVVASTLPEIEAVLPLASEGVLDECLYGFPVVKSVLPRLHELSKSVGISLLVDHKDQIAILEEFARVDKLITGSWPVFIKINVGSNRAGIPPKGHRMPALVKRVETSSAVALKGFYCHAGHSYAGRTMADAKRAQQDEVDGILQALWHTSRESPLVVSVGATPTAHIISTLRATLPQHAKLELHAGNFPCLDLQQVSTGLVPLSDQSVRVLAEIASVYPERNEALINAGVIALSREVSAYPGFGLVVDKPGWEAVRVSQEYGVIGYNSKAVKNDVEGQSAETFHIGQKVQIYCQHTCITAAAFFVHYVVNEDGIVIDTWVPVKWW